MDIAIAQLPTARGDPDANEAAILAAIGGARRAGARLLVTSGGALPERGQHLRVARLAQAAGPLCVVVGVDGDVAAGPRPHAAPAVCVVGAGADVVAAGVQPAGFRLTVGGWRLALAAVDARGDLAGAVTPGRAGGDASAEVALLPAAALDAATDSAAGCAADAVDAVVHLATVPWPAAASWRARVAREAARLQRPLVVVNAVGVLADGLACDGGSCVIAGDGTVLQQLPVWTTTLALARLERDARRIRGDVDTEAGRDAYFALCARLAADWRPCGAAAGPATVAAGAPHGRAGANAGTAAEDLAPSPLSAPTDVTGELLAWAMRDVLVHHVCGRVDPLPSASAPAGIDTLAAAVRRTLDPAGARVALGWRRTLAGPVAHSG